jgi:hypothetical protein
VGSESPRSPEKPCIFVRTRREPGVLAFCKTRLTDRRAGRRWLFCWEECKQRDSNHAHDHNVLGLSFLCIPCATACADMIVIVIPWARLDHAP